MMSRETYERRFDGLDYLQSLLMKGSWVLILGAVLGGIVLKVAIGMFHWAMQ